MLIENNVGDFITWALQNKQNYKIYIHKNTKLWSKSNLIFGSLF